MTAYGFSGHGEHRLNESGKWHPDAIERAPAHRDFDLVRNARHSFSRAGRQVTDARSGASSTSGREGEAGSEGARRWFAALSPSVTRT
jgi:hypothetical protein